MKRFDDEARIVDAVVAKLASHYRGLDTDEAKQNAWLALLEAKRRRPELDVIQHGGHFHRTAYYETIRAMKFIDDQHYNAFKAGVVVNVRSTDEPLQRGGRHGGEGQTLLDILAQPKAKSIATVDDELVRFERLVAGLGRKDRQILRLRFVADFGPTAIAAETGRSTRSIASRLREVTERMRRCGPKMPRWYVKRARRWQADPSPSAVF